MAVARTPNGRLCGRVLILRVAWVLRNVRLAPIAICLFILAPSPPAPLALSLLSEQVPTPGYTIEARVYEKYFNRPAYHLFSSTHQPKNLWELTKSQVIHANWVLSVLYRKALDIRINDKPHH